METQAAPGTKTPAGQRDVTLSPESAFGLSPTGALRAEQAQQEKDRAKAGPKWADEGWCFATATGGVLDPNRITRAFRGWRDRAGAREMPLHSTRHTAVTREIASGVDLAVVAKRIGHKKYAFTVDMYGHLSPEANQDAAAKAGAFHARRKAAKKAKEAAVQ